MTYNKFANGGLYNQMGGNTDEFKKKGNAGARVIGVLLMLVLLAAAGTGIWFMQ